MEYPDDAFHTFPGPWQWYLLGSQWDNHKMFSEDELSFYGSGGKWSMTIFILGYPFHKKGYIDPLNLAYILLVNIILNILLKSSQVKWLSYIFNNISSVIYEICCILNPISLCKKATSCLNWFQT